MGDLALRQPRRAQWVGSFDVFTWEACTECHDKYPCPRAEEELLNTSFLEADDPKSVVETQLLIGHCGDMTDPSSTTAVADAVSQEIDIRRRLPSPQMRRALRVASGLSAAELAALMGVTRQAVSKWERGVRTPRGQHLATYVAVLERLALPSAS